MKRLTPERQQILAILADGLPHTPSDIADKLNKKRSNINHLMIALLDRGLVYQPTYGTYMLAPQHS
jgi:DNA-binding MarR family transcriptional regulator